ncbi:MAG: hypothetical protein JXA22_02440 [Candidatus Thermoplasmatota archaeon]|nr:hypothetical protein [Candidatus Thermoplasmatota archaeon]
MRNHGIKDDVNGREAFAYLAISLMVLTTFYVSFQVSIEREWERGLRDGSIISDMSMRLEEFKSSISRELVSLHDEVMTSAEVELLEDGGGTRLDGDVEGRLTDILASDIRELTGSLSGDDPSLIMNVMNWSVDSRPIQGGVDLPVPGTRYDRNVSGLSDTCPGSEVFGVNTTIHLSLELTDEDSSMRILDEMDIEVSRLSLTGFLNSRTGRLQEAVECGELSSLVEYMIGSLAQMKCLMGYGREPGAGEIVPVTLLTEKELVSVMDLAFSLLARSYLRSRDDHFMDDVGTSLASAPGAIGKAMLTEVLENSTSHIDPGMVVLLGEGIFHQDNPPSLQTMFRPFFYSIVDLLVNRMVSYIGLEDDLYLGLGGLKTIMELGVEAADSLSSSILGIDIIDASRETAEGMLKSLLERSPLMDPEDDLLMVREKPGASWNGGPIATYPLIDIPDMERSFEIGLSDGGPGNTYYRSMNGSVHSMAEYFDPSEEFVGMMCNVYRVTASFDLDPMEPPFRSRDLVADKDFISALAYFLGTDESDTGSLSENEFREKGRYAIKKVIDDLFGSTTSRANERWLELWKGWSLDDLPSMEKGIPTLGSMIDIDLWPLLELAEDFASALVEEFNAVSLFETLFEVEKGYSALIADWLFINYDIWADRTGQMQSCEENRTSIIFENTAVYITDIERTGEEVIYGGNNVESGKDNTDVLHQYPELAKWIGLGLCIDIPMDPELDRLWSASVSSSYLEMSERELGDGSGTNEEGWIRRELVQPPTRGFELTFSSYNGDSLSVMEEVEELVKRGLDTIGSSFDRGLHLAGSRFFLPPLPVDDRIEVSGIGLIPGGPEDLYTDLRVHRREAYQTVLRSISGEYNTDPMNSSAPYTTGYQVDLKGTYDIELLLMGEDMEVKGASKLSFPVSVQVNFEVGSYWPMLGVEYELTGNFQEYLVDRVLEAKDALKAELNCLVQDLLGGSMSSLREVPPIILDIVRGGDLDLAEIARVVSNVTMDLSSTLRETVKELIRQLIDMGISGILNATCGILGIDRIDLKLDAGSFKVAAHTERKALTGADGNILNITFDIPSIGMHCIMSFNRVEGGKFDFSGTVTFDMGPLYLRLELDPFMLRAPHMVSIEVRYEASPGNVIMASFECPALEEYRSYQVSLGDTLGMEPFIPIPPLGVQAVIDAGFRLNYRMPEELGPHINEVEVRRGNISRIEIFDPRGYPIYSSTLSLETMKGVLIGTWRLEPESGRFILIGINATSLWRWVGSIPDDGWVRIVLRSPSGLVWDDLEADLTVPGWLSRDADGYGVWRHTMGTPGYQNGGALPTDIRSLLVSIALTSLKEAWTEAYRAYGLTFDVIVPFIERSIDLFMERFLSVVRELVIDVRLFLSVEIEDASGTAGGGLELSFQADGEAVASFLGWLYENIKIFIGNLADPRNSGDYRSFPLEILSRCYIGLDIFMEVEMPGPVAKMAPEGVDLPDSFVLAIMGKVNLAFPMKLLGRDVGGTIISLGVYVKDAPDAIVSLFYDIGNIGMTQDLYLLRATIWEASTEHP